MFKHFYSIQPVLHMIHFITAQNRRLRFTKTH